MKFKKQRPKFLVFSKFCQIKKLRKIIFIILLNYFKNSLPFLKFSRIYIFLFSQFFSQFHQNVFIISSNFFRIGSNFLYGKFFQIDMILILLI